MNQLIDKLDNSIEKITKTNHVSQFNPIKNKLESYLSTEFKDISHVIDLSRCKMFLTDSIIESLFADLDLFCQTIKNSIKSHLATIQIRSVSLIAINYHVLISFDFQSISFNHFEQLIFRNDDNNNTDIKKYFYAHMSTFSYVGKNQLSSMHYFRSIKKFDLLIHQSSHQTNIKNLQSQNLIKKILNTRIKRNFFSNNHFHNKITKKFKLEKNWQILYTNDTQSIFQENAFYLPAYIVIKRIRKILSGNTNIIFTVREIAQGGNIIHKMLINSYITGINNFDKIKNEFSIWRKLEESYSQNNLSITMQNHNKIDFEKHIFEIDIFVQTMTDISWKIAKVE